MYIYTRKNITHSVKYLNIFIIWENKKVTRGIILSEMLDKMEQITHDFTYMFNLKDKWTKQNQIESQLIDAESKTGGSRVGELGKLKN